MCDVFLPLHVSILEPVSIFPFPKVYIAPQMTLFGSVTDPDVLYNNMRVYGTILLTLTAIVVFFGVKFVSFFF